jgi:hypothetical protein
MNLTDLREELSARAAESDEHPSDLLAGVRRKITRTKRRRLAGVLVGTAAVTALAIGVLPGLTDTSTPEPAVTPTVPTGKHQPDGPPTQTPPTGAGDYVKDGIRYRAKVGGDSLAAAVIGSPGQASVKLKFTATGAKISLRTFCTANPQYQVAVNLSSGVEKTISCDSQSTDAGGHGGLTISDPSMVGEVVEATVTLRDGRGRPVSRPGVRIGLGIYRPGAQRIIGGVGDQQVSLDEVTEYGGYLYKLTDVRTVDAKTTDHLDIATPEAGPFLVAYGSTDLGAVMVKATLTGLSPAGGGYSGSGEHGTGVGLVGQAARKAGTARITVTGGKPTGGKLLLGIYVPKA